ncbi:Lysophospholipase [Purpureocillium takamizusanense]|uniref:Lysophospholipase n=1 Tax=Purpureocillium takamizusanense TaxID=2060973 RepID=A0A9Q8VGZ6_9HYPO|nr:Lysophospholipase [Purpureocillium takamizusanense]UNI24257.1 Lysophospholipase [Purpureocillium takamizusanense]
MPCLQPEHDGASTHAFGNTFILPPSAHHDSTVIFLHRRGSTGREFCSELATSVMSNLRTLQNALRCRGFRLVFPTARLVFSHCFAEWTPAWLGAFFRGLDYLDEDHHEVVTQNIVDGIDFLHSLIDDETELVGGNARNVFLVGMGEVGSIGMWALLTQPSPARALGGFIGINASLPFAPSMMRHLRGEVGQPRQDHPGEEQRRRQDEFVRDMLGAIVRPRPRVRPEPLPHVCRTPVLLMHGTDNEILDVERGREAYALLSALGFRTAWLGYAGAEEDGNWIKEPEGMDDIFEFISGSR